MFMVVHVYESNSYVVLYLLVIFLVSMLTVLLFICVIVHDIVFMFVLVSLGHIIRVNTHLLKSLSL